MGYETILVEKEDKLTVITLNRPDALNAVNSQLWQELGTALEDFANDSNQWVAILTGAGDKAFCAGADLKEIAAVNGFALGGGTVS